MKNRLLQKLVIGLTATVLLLTGPFSGLTLAADSSCAKQLSDLDCQALLNDWVDWVPNTCNADGTTSLLSGTDNIEKAFNFFVGKGLSPVFAAAVVGNLQEESGVDPTKIQEPPDGPGGNTVDPTTLSPTQWPKAGWGIAQWTPAVKILDIAAGLKITGPISDLATQLDIVWAEMTGTSPVGQTNMAKGLQLQPDLASAVEYFRANFEGGSINQARLTDAEQILQAHGAAAVATNAPAGCSGLAGCAGGSGAGSFTDNTSIPFPNVQRMCQRAEEMTNPSSAVFTYWWQHGFSADITNPAALGPCADIGPGNPVPGTDPPIICNAGWCAFTAAYIWGYTHAGYGFATHNDNTPQSQIHDGNTYMWNSLIDQGVAHIGDRNPPVGAFLFYDNFTVNPSTGHVVIYLGHNTVVTTDMSSDGKTKLGFVGIVPAKDIENGPWNQRYLGWAEPKLQTPPAWLGE